ncbi:ATP synthase F1 subunit delta [Candidatus Falkowbacteria bacterium CG10_big_fil_rev_8_21_14_0_10_39_11]|uniref:ATP synthase subunit delta n=1 Tax=Candidatus Falkowbacteria bacterium CG10_big_fil_rev_8_21_14_0_10_39_11 TaxID=1974565 RepID=A0A2H0V5N7_9BACT|nr:MAG: ATP synthase F1 subunit delta [Candidatus Falkowbacteria bacterium CG10_big_fil_rev_8_21_14_0_10_39_11]
MKRFNIKHYAKALSRIGRDQGIFDELMSDAEHVAEKIDENVDLKKYLTDPHVPLGDKKKALQMVFQDFVSVRTINFVLLLIKSKRLGYLNQIIIAAKSDFLVDDEILEVTVESVIPITPDQTTQLESILVDKLGSKILIKNFINENIVGGLRLSVGDTVIDSSIAGKIERLKTIINGLE